MIIECQFSDLDAGSAGVESLGLGNMANMMSDHLIDILPGFRGVSPSFGWA